ncbi:Protein RtcB [Cystobacter fuscus DSM 2262]|uniref:3'-phosphate/5'-hydroxy nucleic acid ligase n=1 Tax=Cystobacter fuscus (strain ATCC 25194 / DSM 2262 / NBRC 100088 / M29) TaxID=1242864 RepID=S9PGM4_CYSF2|nr:RtcB family protein [Cystobacter fuscus]EPX62221.1 Protein RtcB [Cystobacter fuscus DSM 2262]
MRTERDYEVLTNEAGGVPIKAWTVGVPFEDEAKKQLRAMAALPFVHKWVAAMPDVHRGFGATVGSVVATAGAVIPAAVGVDIGCGMIAVRTTLRAEQLPDSLGGVRSAIERAVPHGRTDNGGRNDRGTWKDAPSAHREAWGRLKPGYDAILEKHPRLGRGPDLGHLGTLGTGNHFIEVCLDEADHVWVMLHSGSRGVGNRIGSHFIELAKEDMRRFFIQLPEADLAYLPEGTEHFEDYLRAVGWAQEYAATNRELMLRSTVEALQASGELPEFSLTQAAVNCHHNYVSREHHYGKNVLVTRKGAVRAREGDLGIIPGSMGARSYIVRGKGNAESFHSCSHGAGRVMSREAAKRRFTLEDHARATEGIECRKDADVIDETPGAYKPIDEVMRAQASLVDVVHTLRQVVCVKG